MIDVNKKFDIFEFVLFENEVRTNNIAKLTLHEVSQKNYAFRLNRVNKCYKLKSEVDLYKSTDSTILVLPKGQ